MIKHIVFEFHGEGASTDRFLFPPYAALDLRFGGVEMTASFFVERSGESILQAFEGSNGNGLSVEEMGVLRGRYEEGKEYYQPVTIVVRANQHKTIENIARAARTLPEVQEYMRGVMKEKARAEREFLVLQLPREKGVVVGDVGQSKGAEEARDSGVEMGSGDEDVDHELKGWYGVE
jgi:hypothetical protein